MSSKYDSKIKELDTEVRKLTQKNVDLKKYVDKFEADEGRAMMEQKKIQSTLAEINQKKAATEREINTNTTELAKSQKELAELLELKSKEALVEQKSK
jgi:hypothetical protein